jgi:tetratricopeptide (TPR) repeat protein
LLSGIADDRRRQDEIDLGTAQLLLEEGRTADAVVRFRQLLSSPDARVASKARWGLATSLEAAGDLEAAIVEYEGLRDVAVSDDAGESLLAATTALSRCYREAGDLAHAVEVGEAALARSRRYGLAGTDGYIIVLVTVAGAYLERGDVTKTRYLLGEIQQHVDALGSPRSRGAAYWNAAALAGELGDTAESVRLIERALALFGEGNDERNIARLRTAHATLLMRHDPARADDAATMLVAARDKLAMLGSEVDVAYCETELARALTLSGRPEQAVRTARDALGRLELGMRLESARARVALASALAATGDVAEARTEYLAAASALEAMNARRQAALVWLELAEMERATGDLDQAFTAISRSLAAGHLRAPFPFAQAPVRSTSARRRR